VIKQKYIILDRDGVINKDSPDYIKTPNEFSPLPRSLSAIKLLTDNDFSIIIISNQSGINQDLISPSNFIQINLKMISLIEKSGGAISALLYCPSLSSSDSFNRKPQPGMYIDIADRMNINLTSCYAIGDSPRDIEAAHAVNCKPLGVLTGNGREIQKNNKYDVPIFNDLYEAAEFIVSK
jgi:D-glycero-D-manno-heptose 1,7-bisphosphate phosphatase